MKNIYIILATIALMAGVFFMGDRHGKAVMQVKIAAANAKYQKLKDSQQEKVDEITQTFTNNINAVTRQRDAALRSLRDRSNRMPKAAKAKCKGTTGAELSGPDAEFLTREAARADQLREALTACYNYADTLQ